MSAELILIRASLDELETPRGLAAVFAAWNDDEQAQFFVEVAKAMGEWQPHARQLQERYIARHLAECECATEDAREMLIRIVEAMTEKPGETTP